MAKRKPRDLKLLQGTYRPDRDTGAEYEPGIPELPRGLNERALQIAEQWAPKAIRQGTLTEADGLAFGLLCDLAEKHERRLTEDRTMTREAMTTYTRLLREFRLSPADRPEPKPRRIEERGFDID